MFENLNTDAAPISLTALESVLPTLTEAEFRQKVQILSSYLFKNDENFVMPPPEYKALLSLCRRFYNRKDFPNAAAFTPCNLSSLCDDLAFCADLCSPKASVLFHGAAELHTAVLPRAMRWAILNLLRFALYDTENDFVALSLQERCNFLFLGIHAKVLSPADFQNALSKEDSGLSFAMRTANLHGGTLFFKKERTENAIFLCFPMQDVADGDLCALETFDELLSDRFSPLYVALLG